MLTCSELLKFIARLGTACLLTWVLSGLSGCDQSNTSTVPSSPDSLASTTPPSAEHTPPRESIPATPTPPDDRPRIIAFGDSLTAGLGVAPEQSYPTQLQKQLDALGYRYQVLNAGVSGDTSAGGLRRVSWVLAGKPRVVILELGGNDGLRGLGLPETQSHLDAIIRQLKDAHVRVILAGMKLPPNYGEEYTARFEAMYRDLAQLYELPLIPFLLEGVGGEKTLNQADGIHPTAEGYRIVVENVLRSLLPVLKDTSTNNSSAKKKKA
ncbi:MAG: arylesterase [Nitrospira sp.]|nr:arylesterase [Nitrospira sp.]